MVAFPPVPVFGSPTLLAPSTLPDAGCVPPVPIMIMLRLVPVDVATFDDVVVVDVVVVVVWANAVPAPALPSTTTSAATARYDTKVLRFIAMIY